MGDVLHPTLCLLLNCLEKLQPFLNLFADIWCLNYAKFFKKHTTTASYTNKNYSVHILINTPLGMKNCYYLGNYLVVCQCSEDFSAIFNRSIFRI